VGGAGIPKHLNWWKTLVKVQQASAGLVRSKKGSDCLYKPDAYKPRD
jgi:hypothetical protein